KRGREYFEIGRLAPLLGRLVFDRDDVVEDQAFFAIARQAQFAGKFLSRPPMIQLDRRPRDVNVFRAQQGGESLLTQAPEGIADFALYRFVPFSCRHSSTILAAPAASTVRSPLFQTT